MAQKFSYQDHMKEARRRMVQGQLQTNRITEPRLLQAMLDIPRELFVPQPLVATAYLDRDIPLGAGRYLLEPLLLAWLFQAAEIRPQDRILELGSNSGYGLALLAELGRRVVGVESDEALIALARDSLGKLHLKTEVVKGDPSQGLSDHAPYDLIVIAAAVEQIPEVLFDQLAKGGRLVTILQKVGRGRGVVIVKNPHGVLHQTTVFEAERPVLPEFSRVPEFVF
ncbi:MAG: protein-L-isoaspartate O-methyltransferase [Alphaproteobacteria bacterium]|nr:protein-L-isoaspartate O-methyltransferase [Alphaproteobacteria bacterium]